MDTGSEFSAESIPKDRRVAWPRVAAVAGMVAFSLPTFITGLEISNGMSSLDALAAIAWGSLVITIIGSVMGAVGAITGLSSYLLVRVAFGDRGAGIVNIAFAVSLLGWFGVNINLFTEAVTKLSATIFGSSIDTIWLSILASACMTVTTLIGFRAINLLATLLVPILALVTVLFARSALQQRAFSDILQLERVATISPGEAISAIAGAVIVGAIILPDITRFARHWSGAVYTAVISYLAVQVAVMGSASLAGSVSGETNILDVMLSVNLGFGAFAIVIAGSWVLNSLNLYSAVLSTKATFPALNHFWLTLGLGAAGVIAALMNILGSFVAFLFYLSVIFIPVAGVIIVDYALIRRASYSLATVGRNRPFNSKGFIAWALGAAFAVLTSDSLLASVTGVAAIDAVILSGSTYLALSWNDRRAWPASKSP